MKSHARSAHATAHLLGRRKKGGRGRDGRWNTSRRRFAAALSALVVGAVLMLGIPAQASVETDSRRVGLVIDGVSSVGYFQDVYIGSFNKDGSDKPWFCIEFGAPVTANSVGEVTEQSSPGFRKAAYLIGRYGSVTDPKVHAAIALAIHSFSDTTQFWRDHQANLRVGVDELAAAGTSALADSLVAEAEAASGPWTMSTPSISVDSDGHKGTVNGVQIVSASGAVQDVPVALTVAGDGYWEDTGTNTTTVSSGFPSRRFVLRSGGGTVSVTATFAGAPAGHALVSALPGSQTHATTAEPEIIEAIAEVAVDDWAVSPFATTVANPVERQGKALTDVLAVSLPEGQTWPTSGGAAVPATFAVDWYYSPVPIPEKSAVPKGSPYATGSVTVAGAGKIAATANRQIEDPGYYYPVASFTVSSQPEQYRRYFATDWRALAHEADEQTLALWQPKVTTETTTQRIDVGNAVADSLTVSGNEPNTTLKVDSTLWGPLPEAPVFVANADHITLATPVPADTPRVATVTTSVRGNATVNTESIEVSEPGYYVWTETAAATSVTEAWHSDWAPHAEVSFRVFEPRVTTVVSETAVSSGTMLTDLIDVTGNDPNRTLTVASTLYGPFSERPERVVNPVPTTGKVELPKTDLPVAGTVTTTIVGNGKAQTPGVALTAPGYYVWVESIAPTDTTAGWAGDFGQSDEIGLVLPILHENEVLAETRAGASPWQVLVSGLLLLGAGIVVMGIVVVMRRREPWRARRG